LSSCFEFGALPYYCDDIVCMRCLSSIRYLGKRSDGIRKELDKAIKECVWRQPSLLYIEDLDSLCRAPAGPEEETNPDTVYSLKAAEGSNK